MVIPALVTNVTMAVLWSILKIPQFDKNHGEKIIYSNLRSVREGLRYQSHAGHFVAYQTLDVTLCIT